MKKSLIAAAIVAAVGFSAHLGLRPDPASSLTELQLANAEALCNDENEFIFVSHCDDTGLTVIVAELLINN
ncbi:MAG: hypothetical protein HDS00_08610 [Bacteroides sp.]|nr:hypothetical protein [Bacteroides sp.]